MTFWLLLEGSAIALTVLVFTFIKRPLPSALIATAVPIFALQLHSYWRLGYFDPFWPIAVGITSIVTIPVTVIAALLWRRISSGGLHVNNRDN